MSLSPIEAAVGAPEAEETPEMSNVHLAPRRRIALIAHDARKPELLDWARVNRAALERHELFGTGTTGRMLDSHLELPVTCFLSGPMGGDQQIGAGIAEGRLDFVIFFWDPLEIQPHDVDVKALLRIAVVYNCPIACNRATADFMLSSPMLNGSTADETSPERLAS